MNAKERTLLQNMYRSLEGLPGRIREGGQVEALSNPGMDPVAMARGAERARVLVYAWLREANMIPQGGR